MARGNDEPQEILLTRNAPHGVAETLMENYSWAESEVKSESGGWRAKQKVQHNESHVHL